MPCLPEGHPAAVWTKPRSPRLPALSTPRSRRAPEPGSTSLTLHTLPPSETCELVGAGGRHREPAEAARQLASSLAAQLLEAGVWGSPSTPEPSCLATQQSVVAADRHSSGSRTPCNSHCFTSSRTPWKPHTGSLKSKPTEKQLAETKHKYLNIESSNDVYLEDGPRSPLQTQGSLGESSRPGTEMQQLLPLCQGPPGSGSKALNAAKTHIAIY